MLPAKTDQPYQLLWTFRPETARNRNDAAARHSHIFRIRPVLLLLKNMMRFLFPLVIICLCVSFFRLSSVTLFDVDEAVFAEASKEMIENNDWLTPTYNAEIRYDKPILFYWLMAASYKMFGINEFAARFPSALSASVLALALFFFARHSRNEQYALFASISFVVSFYFFVYSHSSVTDMTLTLFISLSLFSFYLSEEDGGKPMYLYGFYLFSALAFLTKGLIGIAFPFGVAITYMFFIERWQGVRKVFSLRGIVLFFVVGAPWYLAQLLIHGQEFVEQFFVKHHFKRYLDVISGHRGPFYYYIPVFIIGLFPWSIFLPLGIRNAIKSRERLILFGLVWFGFIFVFFSLSTTKLPNYILPATPAASLIIASGIMQYNKRWWRSSNVFLALLCLLMGTGLLISRSYLLQYGITDVSWVFAIASIIIIMGLFYIYSAYADRLFFWPMSALMLLLLLGLSVTALPLASDYLQGALHRYSLYAKMKLHEDQRIIVYGINNPSIVFYSGHKIMHTGSRDDVKAALMHDGKPFIAITKIRKVDDLRELGFTVIESDKKYALLEKK